LNQPLNVEDVQILFDFLQVLIEENLFLIYLDLSIDEYHQLIFYNKLNQIQLF